MAKKSKNDVVLAGDVGGTNARLRLCSLNGQKILHEQTFPSGSSRSLAAILEPFVRSAPGHVRAAVLGIAGPVVDGVSRTTNLPWVIDEQKLATTLKIPKVKLVNDMAAIAMGCLCLKPTDRKILAKGRPPKAGNAAVIAAGTGLGEGLMLWQDGQHFPTASEGGHSDFAPCDELQAELLQFLREILGKGDSNAHVSYERVLSGPGIGNLYDFFCGRSSKPESAEAELTLLEGDRNAAITKLGLKGQSASAAQAIDMFAAIYGAEVGNLALKGLATFGVYVCGRIGAEIVPKRKQIFLAAMRDKGRLSPLVERVPVYLVDDSLVGLLGASCLAARLADEG
jgi:glucokinase